ncbi:MAG: S41 family peptidase [Sedimentisphaerales bacterium]
MKKTVSITLIVLLFSFQAIAQDVNGLSTEGKIYGLSKIWKEASYNFAFFDQIPDVNWDSCYQAFIPQVMATKSDWEYYLVLEKFFALLKDGHTRIFPPAELRNKYYGTATKQIKTRLIEDKVIITEVLDNALAEAGVRKGMEILTINSIDVNEYAKKYVSPYMFASTPQDLELQTFGHFLLSGSVTEPAIIKVRDFDGKTRTHSIYRQPWLMEAEVFQGEPMVFKILSNNIGYLKINNFVDTKDFRPKFDSIYTKILATDGLIIDVRENFGGATQITYYVLKHLSKEKFKTVNWKSPMYVAANKAWGMNKDWLEVEGKEIEPFKDRAIYTKPVNVIADESSFSGAEDFCVGFKTMKRGKLVGRKTAGSTGSPLMFNLPGGASVLICTKKDMFPDGTEFVGYGIAPDIEVGVTIEDIRNGNDGALNAAIKDLSGK